MGSKGEKGEFEREKVGREMKRAKREERHWRNRLKTAILLGKALIALVFTPTHTPLFIYNTCTDCFKLYITDQQAGWLADWLAIPPTPSTTITTTSTPNQPPQAE